MAIRWKQGDYIRLGRAVAEFNREIAKNETETNKLHLPQTIDYRTLRDRIQTRQGLNAYINSLKRIKLPGAFNIEKLENGELITTYEKRELERSRASYIKDINKQIQKLENQTKINLGIDSDIELPNAFKSIKQKQLEAKLRDYKKLYSLSGKDFRRRARELGINVTELKYKRAYIFRQNYMKVMREKYSSYENFQSFLNWANRHKNPIDFFESLPDTEFYPDDLHYQSDNTFNEEDFNGFLGSLGIDVEYEATKRRALKSKREYYKNQKQREEAAQIGKRYNVQEIE